MLTKIGALMSPGGRLHRFLTGRGVRIVISVGLLAFLISQIDLRAMLAELAGVRPGLVMLMVIAIITTRLVGAFRWYLLLRARHPAISFSGVVRLTFVSDFVGYFTPGSLGTEVIRLYGMAKTTSDAALSAASMLVERAIGLLTLVLLVLLGIGFTPPGLPSGIGPLAWLALALLAVGTALVMTQPSRRLTLYLLASARLQWVRSAAQKVYLVLDYYRRRPGLLTAAFTTGLLFQLLRCAVVAIGAAAFGVHMPFLLFMVIMPVILLITLLPISIAGLGVREVGFVYLFGLAGMPAEIALALALLTRLLNLLMALPGAWFYIRHGVVAWSR
jgi:uncharacterized membrane protein YbhN (UPF0104 family)